MPRIKLSQDVGKITMPGRKDAYRLYGADGQSIYIYYFLSVGMCRFLDTLDSGGIDIYSLLGSRYFVSNSLRDKITNVCHLILNSACKSNFIAE